MKRKLVYFAVLLSLVFCEATYTNVKKLPQGYNKVNNVLLADSHEEIINRAQTLLDEALREKTFYKFNVAYSAIMKIQDTSVRDLILGQLSTITDTVWTEDIKKHVALLAELTATGSGKIYDKLDTDMRKSNLNDIDKGYLLGELTSWGLKLVYTDDYKNAVDKVVYAWKMLDTGTEQNITSAINDAQSAINSVKNTYSKAYLLEQLDQIKVQTEFSVIDIK